MKDRERLKNWSKLEETYTQHIILENIINQKWAKWQCWPAGEIWIDGYTSDGYEIPILIPDLEDCILVMQESEFVLEKDTLECLGVMGHPALKRLRERLMLIDTEREEWTIVQLR